MYLNSSKLPKEAATAENIADQLSEFLNDISELPDLSDHLDEYDLDHLGAAMDALYWFAQSYASSSRYI